MKKKYISLNIKTAVVYILLVVLTISVVASLIFENQSDLIVKNSVLEAEKVVYNIKNEIRIILKQQNFKNEKILINEIEKLLRTLQIKKYILFSEQAERLAVSAEALKINTSHRTEFTNINRAIFKNENQGKIFHAEISETILYLNRKMEINFYIPLTPIKSKSIILKLSMRITGIDYQIQLLYRQLAVLVAGLIFVVFLIAILYNRLFINPVKQISMASEKVANGDYETKLNIKNNDEIGILSNSFNNMVDSLSTMTTKLKDTISTLEEQNDLVQHELDIARSIQQGMLPVNILYERANLSVYYRAFEKISGDYYDFLEFPDGSLGIIIADVSGHGIPAALITIMIKIIFQTYGPDFKDPAKFLDKMNIEIARSVKTGDYITAFYCIIDRGNMARFASAGHHAALLHKNKNFDIVELKEEGIFLGLTEDPHEPFSKSEALLEKGDRLILYTDGITDQRDPGGCLYGCKKLKEIIKANSESSVEYLVNNIIKSVAEFSKGSPDADDQTLIAIEITKDVIDNK